MLWQPTETKYHPSQMQVNENGRQNNCSQYLSQQQGLIETVLGQAIQPSANYNNCPEQMQHDMHLQGIYLSCHYAKDNALQAIISPSLSS